MRPKATGERDTNAKTAQLAKLITEVGPDVAEISRRLGQFKESVRYRYKEKVLGNGFVIHALPDHEKLGLRRVVLLADFGTTYAPYANSILTAMSELCYVVSFEKVMFRGNYVVEASVPSEVLGAFTEFMLSLREKGLFRSLEVIPFEWFRTVPMRTEHYDFDTGRWDFDWSSIEKSLDDAGYRPSKRVKFDREDLLILKELQMDATRSLTEIAERVQENYKKLAWHYKVHVLERGLINGYALRWMGTSYSTVLEKALHRKHRYQHLGLLATNLTEVERMRLMERAHSVPFIWNEMVSSTNYSAHFYFPTEYITEAYQFFTAAISDVKDKSSVMALDQTEALTFTIAYKLYDEKTRQWSFDGTMMVERFGDLIAKIKEIGESV